MTAQMRPLVVDLFSGDKVESFDKVYAAGIRGVILKASQGTRYTDKTFAQRRDAARAAGLLVGAYHFGTSAPVDDQVAHFLEVVGEDPDLLLALDYEKNEPSPSDSMAFEQAKDFLRAIREKTGQRPVLYSGSLIKEKVGRKGDAFISEHRLWLAHYSETPTLPAGFDRCFLHQYTGDGQGPGPHEVDGIATKGIDCNVFGGGDLAAEWIDRPETDAVAEAPRQRKAEVADEGAPSAPTVIGTERVTVRERARVLQDTIDMGSRLGGSIRNGLNSIKMLLFGATTIGGAATMLDPKKGSAQVATDTLSTFPVLLVAIFALLIGIAIAGGVAWWFFSHAGNGLVTAVRRGAYSPPNQTTAGG